MTGGTPRRLPPVPTESRQGKRWEVAEDELILVSQRTAAQLAKIMGRTTHAIQSRRMAYHRGALERTW